MTSQSSELRRSALFFAVSFVQALDNQLIPVLLPVLKKDMPGAPAGYLLTAYAVACGVIPFLATARGRGDRLKILSVGALVVLGAAAFALGATSAFPVRLVARAGAGAASGMLSMTLLLAAARTPDERVRARRFTVITAGQLAALVAGVPIVAKLTSAFGMAAVFQAIGAVALVLALPLALLAEPRSASDSARRQSFLRLFRLREPALVLLATGIVGAGIAGPVGYLSSFLDGVRHLEIDAIGAVYMWAGIGPLLAMPFSGRLIARFAPSRVAIAGSLIIAVPMLFFPEFAVSVPTAAAMMFVCVFIETIRRAALQGTLSDAVPDADRPRYFAFRGVVLQLGLAAGYALAEAEFTRSGFRLVCIVAALLSVAAAGILFTATALRPVTRPEP